MHENQKPTASLTQRSQTQTLKLTKGARGMKAAIYRHYGGPEVVTLKDVPKPSPKPGEVLIRVHATTVNSGDMRVRSLNLPGFGKLFGRLLFGLTGPRKPVLGMEISGVIEAIGDGVTDFKIGDNVFADTSSGFGGHAEYRVMPTTGAIALMPSNLSFEEAAALSFGGITALQFLRDKGEIKAGDHLLVNGGSGTVGSAAVQIGRHFGATVTAITSRGNFELLRGLGADHLIDYNTEDFSANIARYDLIIDTVGTAPWHRSRAALAPRGRLLLVHASLAQMLKAFVQSSKTGRQVRPGVANGTQKDLQFLAELAQSGAYMPLIDQVFPFAEIQAAHARVDQGRKRGSVVVRLI